MAWIGEIPQGWEVRRFKDAGSFQTGRDHKGLNEGCIPVYGSSRESFALVDQVLCKRKAIAIGRKGTIDQPFIIQANFWAVDTCMFHTVLKKNVSLEYVGYWAEIVPWKEISTQTALPSLTQTDANNTFIGYPPFSEQLAIADYLDRQTALIDQRLATLAEKKTILAELRKATIHEAVTKGLNKNAPMKDSGAAWIGEIPQGWKIKRLKSLLKAPLTYGANEAADSDDSANPRFIRITDINENGNLREDTFRSLPLAIARQYLLKEGDVLLARSGATVGKSFIYKHSWGRCCFAGYLIRARLNPEVCVPKFFYACCQSTFYWQYISDTQIQSTIQNVNAEKYANFYLPCPPLSEQLAIAAHLDQQTQQFDAQLATLDEQAKILKELRKAIIHEAVTGKIDLSGVESGKEI